MPCNNCTYWIYTGENMMNVDGIYLEARIGSCTNTEVLDAIIKTVQDENIISISVIMGITTSVTTKEHFECRYYEIKI